MEVLPPPLRLTGTQSLKLQYLGVQNMCGMGPIWLSGTQNLEVSKESFLPIMGHIVHSSTKFDFLKILKSRFKFSPLCLPKKNFPHYIYKRNFPPLYLQKKLSPTIFTKKISPTIFTKEKFPQLYFQFRKYSGGNFLL